MVTFWLCSCSTELHFSSELHPAELRFPTELRPGKHCFPTEIRLAELRVLTEPHTAKLRALPEPRIAKIRVPAKLRTTELREKIEVDRVELWPAERPEPAKTRPLKPRFPTELRPDELCGPAELRPVKPRIPVEVYIVKLGDSAEPCSGKHRALAELRAAELSFPTKLRPAELSGTAEFTMKEARQLLNAAGDMRNGARFVVALTLGLRKGEALGLKWRDIDFEHRTVTTRRTVQRLNWQHGCPPGQPCGHRYAGHCPLRHSGGGVTAEVKSGAGKRTIGLPLPLIEVLKAHRTRQDQDRTRARNLWLSEDWVFTNQLGGPVHPRIDHDAWKNLLKKAGVRDARLHDARHTAATMLLLLKVPDRAVMDIMGWAQVTMTKRYQHITTELTTMIADQVGGLYWSADDDAGDDKGGAAGAPVPV